MAGSPPAASHALDAEIQRASVNFPFHRMSAVKMNEIKIGFRKIQIHGHDPVQFYFLLSFIGHFDASGDHIFFLKYAV